MATPNEPPDQIRVSPRRAISIMFCKEMNLFELNFLASPAGGLLGGIAASADHGAAHIAGAAAGGIAIGFALYFGIIGFGVLVEKIANRGMPQDDKRLDCGAAIMGVLVLLPMTMLPILSGFLAFSCFNLLF